MGIVVIVVVLIIAVMLYSFFRRKQRRFDLKEREKRFKDELIFDPDTGKKLTLEQAEAGYVFRGVASPRIKSDDEIEANYFHEGKEIQYMRRAMLQAEIPLIDLRELACALQQSVMAGQHPVFCLEEAWEYAPGISIGIIQLTTSYRTDNTGTHERQLIIVVSGAGQAEFAALEFSVEVEFEQMQHHKVIRILKTLSYKNFVEILAEIDRVGRL